MDKNKMNDFPYITDKKYPYLLTVAIPTRKRIEHLLETLESIKDNTKDKSRIEIIIRADNDDEETLENLHRVEEYNKHFDMNFIIDERWGGYADMDKILNQCFNQSKGEFFLALNDDCVVRSKDWDEILNKHSGKICVVQTGYKEYNCKEEWNEIDVYNPRLIPWDASQGTHSTIHTMNLCHRIIPETLGYFNCHESGDRQFDYITTFQPSLRLEIFDIELHHYMLPGEHVKDGIITHPDSILGLKKQIEKDSQRLVDELKKTYGNNLS
tara:strand:+ start:836 stop:1642 length:807 start_codon:yes stop_codon:yes gene_type:complete